MTQPLITLIDSHSLPLITDVLHENGFMNRFEIITQTTLSSMQQEASLAQYGYQLSTLNWLKSQINQGKSALVIYDDYEDLPAIFEILNSYGYEIIDTYEGESPLLHSYNIKDVYEMEKECLKDEVWDDQIQIPIPAHFVQDPYEDRI